MQDIPFATPGQAFAQAVPQAAQTISQGMQLGMQAREQRWQKQYQKAAIAVSLISNDNVPDSIKLKAANNGLYPLLSDGQFKPLGDSHDQVKPFTMDDLQDESFKETAQKLKSISEDKELNPNQKRQFQRQTMIDYYSNKGKAAEALKLQEGMLDEQETAATKGFDQAAKLRAEFTKQNESFREIRDATQRVQSVSKDATGPSDLALIYNFMKVLDPKSVVRESEFRSAADAKAWLSKVDMGLLGNVVVPSAVRAAIQKADPTKSGTFLLPEQRKEFVKQVDNIYKGQRQIYDQSVAEFKRLGKAMGIPEEMQSFATFEPGSAEPVKSTQNQPAVAPKKQPTNAADWLEGLNK